MFKHDRKFCRFLLAISISFAAQTRCTVTLAQNDNFRSQGARYLEFTKQGKYAQALEAAQDLLKIVEATVGRETVESATALAAIGLTFKRLKKYSDAELALQKALSILHKVVGTQDEGYTTVLEALSAVRVKQERYAEAEQIADDVLRTREAHLGNDHPDVGISLYNLETVSFYRSKYHQAEAYLLRALAIQEKSSVRDLTRLEQTLRGLYSLYRRTDRPEIAKEYAERLEKLSSQDEMPFQSETSSVPERKPQSAME